MPEIFSKDMKKGYKLNLADFNLMKHNKNYAATNVASITAGGQ